MRLHEHFPSRLAATGTTGDLRNELKGAFRSAEIGQMQRNIGIDHTDECDTRKIKPFRAHLRADEDVEFTAGKIVVDALVDMARSRSVAIEPGKLDERKVVENFFLDALRAHTVMTKLHALALGALNRHGLFT